MRLIFRQSVIGLLLGFVAAAASAATESLLYEEQSLTVNGTRQLARVPKDFRLELLTDKLEGPRLMAFAENGDLVIGSKSGRVYRLPPPYT
ncbi:MAG TPA: hypothetical protein VIR61_05230, partial [Sulfuricaulis sp.]